MSKLVTLIQRMHHTFYTSKFFLHPAAASSKSLSIYSNLYFTIRQLPFGQRNNTSWNLNDLVTNMSILVKKKIGLFVQCSFLSLWRGNEVSLEHGCLLDLVLDQEMAIHLRTLKMNAISPTREYSCVQWLARSEVCLEAQYHYIKPY